MHQSRSLKKAYLHAPSYRVGTLQAIEKIEGLEQDPETLEDLLAFGLETYAHFDGDPFELAAPAIRETLETSRTDPADVDAVIYATTGYATAREPWMPLEGGDRMRGLLQELAMPRAIPFGVGLSQCANLTASISLASSLVASSQYRNVLIFVADRIPEHMSRVVAPGVTVISDAAASCLVSDRDHGGYEILAVAEHLDWPMLDIRPDQDFAKYLQGTAEGIKTVSDEIYQALGTDANGFSQLLINNVNHSVAGLFSRQTGFPKHKIYTDNIARYAHCDAADTLINFCHYARSRDIAAGELLLLLTSAPFMRKAIAFRKAG